MAIRLVDTAIVYRILKMLVTPFDKTQAFKHGIIDAKGKEVKTMSQLNTADERDSYTLLHRLVYRIKRIIEKVPVENKKIASYAAALALIKESMEKGCEPIDLEVRYIHMLEADLTKEINELEALREGRLLTFKLFLEEVPANNAAATPGIDGFTPDTLGVKVTKKPARRKKVIP
jgi:hypothetical protein